MTGIIKEVKVEGAHVNSGPESEAQPGSALRASTDKGLGAQVFVDEKDCRDCKNEVERDMFEGAEKNIEAQLDVGTTPLDWPDEEEKVELEVDAEVEVEVDVEVEVQEEEEEEVVKVDVVDGAVNEKEKVEDGEAI